MDEQNKKTSKRSRILPAETPEARENQLINLAINLVEKKLRDGSASSQILNTLLQSGLTKARLENEKLKSDLRVAEAKIQQMDSQSSSQELFEKALRAFSEYSGQNVEDEYLEDDE